MAVAIDSEMPTNTGQGASGLSSPPSSASFSFTNTAGTILYLSVSISVNAGGSTSFGTVTYGGTTMTKVLEQTSASGASRVGFFRLLSPPTGANTVSISFTLTLDGSINRWAWTAGCISLTGNNTSTPETQSGGSNGSGTTASASLSGVTSLTLGFAGTGSSMTAQTQTLSWSKNTDNLSQVGNGRLSTSTSTGSVTHSYTISASDSWATAVLEIAAATAVRNSFAAIPFQAQGRNL